MLNKSIIIVAFLVTLIPFTFLFSPPPRPEDPLCGLYIRLNSSIGFPLNCDSGALINLAKYPENIFNEGELLQSRPGVIPVGIIFGIPFLAITPILNIGEYLPGTLLDLNYFLAFVLFNFFLLFISIVLFLKITREQAFNTIIRIAGIILLGTNFVIKPFIFTPHQQLFNIFLPIYLIYIIHKGIAKGLSNKEFFLICALTGLGALLYPSIILVLASLFIVLMFTKINKKSFQINHLIYHIIGAALALIPTLLWPIIVRWKTGSYFNHAAESYRQFIWIIDGFQGGIQNGINSMIVHFNSYYVTFSFELIISIILIVLLLIGVRFVLKDKVEQKDIYREVTPYIILLLIVTLFFYFLGSYFDRLTFNVFLITQFILIILVNKYVQIYNRLKFIPYAMLIFVVYKFILLLTQHGPYSP